MDALETGAAFLLARAELSKRKSLLALPVDGGAAEALVHHGDDEDAQRAVHEKVEEVPEGVGS